MISEGALEADGHFRADTVLAKHDETYMPKNVADALKKQGHWKDDYGKPAAGEASQTIRLGAAGHQAMTPEAGHYALVLALMLALIQAVVDVSLHVTDNTTAGRSPA